MINTRSFTDALQYKASRYLSVSSSLRPLSMKVTLLVLLLALAFSAQSQDTTLPADVGTATALATGAPVLGSSDSDIGTTVPGVSDGGGTTLSFEATVTGITDVPSQSLTIFSNPSGSGTLTTVPLVSSMSVSRSSGTSAATQSSGARRMRAEGLVVGAAVAALVGWGWVL